ncbi:hypothetical protein [Nonomuraea sp. NPDC050540]|uniref:hypothetical protein n=1 Tax=Nonomuraea sp. NPDC050540 TaxID=3364367 RepID=UPI003796786F
MVKTLAFAQLLPREDPKKLNEAFWAALQERNAAQCRFLDAANAELTNTPALPPN